ncbi:MAG: GNAT family N-acetyltransferase [Bacilli bacterium]|nr:GNAT family N-acetyltransferase [Bacilli bacterium]
MDKELLKIRKLKPGDARDWLVLVNKVWRDAYSHIFPKEVFDEKDNKVNENVKTFNDKLRNDNENIAYVALYNDEIIGIMCGSIKSPYDRFNSDYADLNAVYIDPKFQGLGIGSKFREIFEEWATQNGATKYVIGVLKDNIKARKVYESWGGKLSELEEDFIKLGVGYPEVFYTFDLEKTLKKHM